MRCAAAKADDRRLHHRDSNGSCRMFLSEQVRGEKFQKYAFV